MQRRYVHGANPGVDDPIAWFSSSSFTAAATRHLFANPQGSVVLSGDSAGNALRIFAYDEYGVPTTAGGAAQLTAANGARFGYTGQAWIPELGMYHYKARVYSPTLGRFMQTDPIGYDDQMNLYAYVGNDPVNGSDPTGMCVTVGDYPPVNCPSAADAWNLLRLFIGSASPLSAVKLLLTSTATASDDDCRYCSHMMLPSTIKRILEKASNKRDSSKGPNYDMLGGRAGAKSDSDDLAKSADAEVKSVETQNGPVKTFESVDGTRVTHRDFSTGSTNVRGGQSTIEIRSPGAENAILRY